MAHFLVSRVVSYGLASSGPENQSLEFTVPGAHGNVCPDLKAPPVMQYYLAGTAPPQELETGIPVPAHHDV